ncbi:zinc finger protein 501-like [Uranotaenia lowii]|uniref:zinc finger protein 501-like n=1 Tax=Uranotaenia lowii TaxID=190385 RepID=UPI002479273F|nr:zinc finger protein 501-like [Uranotaenia lowii]
MEMCRACGEFPNTNDTVMQNLQRFSVIFYNLTSIKLRPEEDPKRQQICGGCYGKLMDYNHFRDVCLQVHSKLMNVKLEPEEVHENEQKDYETFVEELKVEPIATIGKYEPSEDLARSQSVKDDQSDPDVLVDELSTSENDSSAEDKETKKKAIGRKRKHRKGEIKVEPNKPQITYECDTCKRVFRSEMRYQGHMRTHQGLKPAVCNYCGKDFMKYNNLQRHISSKHLDRNTRYPCDFPDCELTYSTKQAMMNHRKRHDPNFVHPEQKRSVCDQCGKTFSTSGALKKHSYIHTGDMPFQCSVCNKKLPTAHKLKEHTMRHEGIKNHVCPYCGQKKTTRHELKVHMNYHTREKQFTCHVCAQVFSNIGNMSRHIKIVHCGIKAFPCTFCDRSFGKAETLKHHIMIHTGEKPHECKTCGRRFIQLVALQTHSKTHHKQMRKQQQAQLATESAQHSTEMDTLHPALMAAAAAAVASHTHGDAPELPLPNDPSSAINSPDCMGGYVN